MADKSDAQILQILHIHSLFWETDGWVLFIITLWKKFVLIRLNCFWYLVSTGFQIFNWGMLKEKLRNSFIERNLADVYKPWLLTCLYLQSMPLLSDYYIISIIITRWYFSDAYEYFYADHRGEGVEYVSEYCEEKTHLKMPKQVLFCLKA